MYLDPPFPNSRYGLCGREATLNKMKALRTQELCGRKGRKGGQFIPSITVPTASVDVKQLKKTKKLRVQEICEKDFGDNNNNR